MKEFKIKDFYQAVVLKTLGLPLLRLERGDGKSFWFVFEDEGELAKGKIDEYWNNKLKVNPKEFVNSIDELKTRLYSSK